MAKTFLWFTVTMLLAAVLILLREGKLAVNKKLLDRASILISLSLVLSVFGVLLSIE